MRTAIPMCIIHYIQPCGLIHTFQACQQNGIGAGSSAQNTSLCEGMDRGCGCRGGYRYNRSWLCRNTATWACFVSVPVIKKSRSPTGSCISWLGQTFTLCDVMAVSTLETLLQVRSLQVALDGKFCPPVTLDGAEVILACNNGVQAAVMTAVNEFTAGVGPLLERAIQSRLPTAQTTIEVKMRQDWVTLPVAKVALKTIVAAITMERLVNKDPSVVTPVDWLAHGLKLSNKDSFVGSVLVIARSGHASGVASAAAKPAAARRASVPPKNLITVRNANLGCKLRLHYAQKYMSPSCKCQPL